MTGGGIRHLERDADLGVETDLTRGPEVGGRVEVEPIDALLEVDLTAFPAIRAWHERIATRPEVIAARTAEAA